MKIIRVFPRKTNLTPVDSNVRFGIPSFLDEADEIHISVTFTYDLRLAEWLAKQWEQVAPVKIGGPATGQPGGQFTPGVYLKPGCVITSRGCNNKCWFCAVPKREGPVRELEIKNGWIVLDDNLLSCSKDHIVNVFKMLKNQPERPEFTGGFEAKLLSREIATQLKELNPKTMFFANDTEDDVEPLIEAGKILRSVGFRENSHDIRAYVLIGYPKDTLQNAEQRLLQTWDSGFFPMAMLYRDKNGKRDPVWKKFTNEWANPVKTACNIKSRKSKTKVN